MPTISQLPLATSISDTDQIPLSQGEVARSTTVAALLAGTQDAITIAQGTLLGRVTNGAGGPESLALGTGLQIIGDTLTVDHRSYPQTGTLATDAQVILNNAAGAPTLMPISLLRGLYAAGQNITIDADGTIHATPAAATGSAIGAVAVGNGLVINASGQLSVNVGTIPGTIAAGDDSRIVNAEEMPNKDQPNGYAGLDSTGRLPAALLPTTIPVTSTSLAGADASQADATPAISGATGRSLAAHFADVVNINDFGLARNGSTDDSAKFVAACQQAVALKRKLYIPPGGPILLTDAASQNLSNITIYGDGIRDYDGPNGYGQVGSNLWFTGTTASPFLLGNSVTFEGINFFWPHQTETATTSNSNLPIVYPPLFAQQSPAVNIVYFNFINCQVTNCYDFFTALGNTAVVGACTFDRCEIYAIHTCFTLQNVPEVVFIGNSLFTFGVYGSVVSVGPTYNLRSYTNENGCWLKVVGNGTTTTVANTTVGGIMSCNTYVYGCNIGIWLAGGTLDISAFVNTSFDTVPFVLRGDPGCAMFSTRFTGGAWYPIYAQNAAGPEALAISITNPAPAGVGLNVTFAGITVPFVDGSLVSISGSNISNLSFSDIRCLALGHTSGGTGPYYAFQLNTPNANIRISGCDVQANNASLSNTGIQISACTNAVISQCLFRYLTAPLDIETTAGQVTLSENTTYATQGAATIIGTGTTNVHDFFNNWDKPNFTYNGLAPGVYRPGATIGVQPVSCSAAAGYVGVQPSASGTGGGTRMGLSALGTSPVSLLTNSFGEEQFRANRLVGAVNYVAVRGALSGQATQITTNGADANAGIQLTGLNTGATYLGSQGTGGSPLALLGAHADQSYVGYAPASGFSITVPANCSTVLLKPASILALGHITLPAAVADGQVITVWSSRIITALTLSATGSALLNLAGAFALLANTATSFFWNAANNTWFQSLGSGAGNGSIAGQDASNVGITGGSITGLSALSVGTDASVSASLVLDSAPGYARQVVYSSASVPRWIVGAEGNAENNTTAATGTGSIASGATNLPLATTAGITTGMLVAGPGIAAGTMVTSIPGNGSVNISAATTAAIPAGTVLNFYTNQGSDFAILPYDDTGAPLAGTLGQPLLITRATGQVSIHALAVLGSAASPTPATGDASTAVATTAFVANTLSAQSGAAGGLATLDGTGHVPASQLPAAVQGALNYQGTWNAATNTPVLTSGTGTKGFYYTVATAGGAALNGITQWNAGDHAAFNGTAWEKLDGLASEVISVAGRTGAVTLAAADIAGLGSIATQSAGAVAISGGTIDGTVLGATTPAAATLASLKLPALTGYLYANATGAATAATTIPSGSVFGLGTLALQSSGAVAITGGTAQGLTLLSVGSSGGGVASSFLNAAAGSARQLVWQTAGATRWNLFATGDAETAAVVLNTTAASTATTLLMFSSTAGVVVGQSVAGTGVPAGALVVSFVANTSVTLSVAATVASGAAISFYANAGSLFSLRAYDDGGNLLYTPFSAARGTGAALTFSTLNSGPITFQSGTVAGSPRGSGAFDGQQIRTTASQIASGYGATVFGVGNTASGLESVAIGGFNVVSGNWGTAPGGYQANDRGRYGSEIFASGAAVNTGDTQTAFGLLRANSTTSAAARMTADGTAAGAANIWNIPNASSYLLRLEILGWSPTGTLAVSYLARFRLKRGATAASTAASNTTLAADADNDSISGLVAPTLGVDTTNGGLLLTSGYATSTAMRWAARVLSVMELQ